MRFFLLFISCVSATFSFSQTDSLTSPKHKLSTKLIAGGIGYGTGMLILNEVWYKSAPREAFHFFNDLPEWYQTDKLGHIYTSYHITSAGYKLFARHNIPEKKALLYSTALSFAIMTPIEWLDGYSTSYGASVSDLVANIGGSLLFYGNHSLSDELFQIKYSFYRTDYAPLRPNVLGESWKTEWLKDYNGQTYWVSIDLHKINSSVPKWLNLAVGMGANGMVHARKEVNFSEGYDSYREFYIALDPDLSHFKSKHEMINQLIHLLDMVHFPAPALEFSKYGVVGRVFR